jgi:hypothetical protein
MISKQHILEIVHQIGGCDGQDDFAKGWDAACDAIYNAIEEFSLDPEEGEHRDGE